MFGKKAQELTVIIYTITRSNVLLKEEQYDMCRQMRRAVVSITSNIVEGSCRGEKEFAHYLDIARGSTAEILSQLETVKLVFPNHTFIIRNSPKEFYFLIEEAMTQAAEIDKMLIGLKKQLG